MIAILDRHAAQSECTSHPVAYVVESERTAGQPDIFIVTLQGRTGRFMGCQAFDTRGEAIAFGDAMTQCTDYCEGK